MKPGWVLIESLRVQSFIAWEGFVKEKMKIFKLLKNTAKEWSEDEAPRLGAALAYYTVFSIAPLIIIAVTIAGLVFANAQQQIFSQVQGLVGDKGASMIQSMTEAAQRPTQSIVATALGFITLLFGAAGVFIQLKSALNTIWDVEPKKSKGGIWGFIRKYFLSFSMVFGIGFLLLVSLLLEAGVAMVASYVANYIPGMEVLMKVGAVVISFGVITLLFALMFKFLPDTKIYWHDVWIGALMTSAMFVIGKVGLGFYLGKASTASAYGAAGSLVIVLLWVYYSSQILFFGAEFTQVYSRHHGSRYKATSFKELLSPKERLVAEMEEQRQRFSKTMDRLQLKTPEECSPAPQFEMPRQRHSL